MDNKYLKPGRARLRSELTSEQLQKYIRNVLIGFICLLLIEQVAHRLRHRLAPVKQQNAVDTLVVYVYSGSDKEYHHNLLFFVEHAIKADDPCQYMIVIQSPGPDQPQPDLPKLPPNAKYLSHANECFDIGTVGWALAKIDDISKYRYFMWVNSSVRGPILPAYWPRTRHWSRAFTDKLSPTVRLAGSTINCGGQLHSGYGYDAHPHVQTYVAATDLEGLRMLIDAKHVFRCHKDYQDAVKFGEMGASQVFLKAGYNLDCLMLRYQGVDWRDQRAWQCNAQLNPVQESSNDGVSVSPTEVLFVKVKSSMVEAQWEHVSETVKYAQALAVQANDTAKYKQVNGNSFPTIVEEWREEAMHRGPECFDYDFFRMANPYGSIKRMGKWDMWFFFLNQGILEGRPYRFQC